MTGLRRLAAFWAVLGFAALMGVAIYRLGSRTQEALAAPLDVVHWLTLIAVVAFMAYTEGYRGFQQSFSPRFAGRVVHLKADGSLLEALLAPAYAMGYFSAPRRVLISTWVLTVMIIAFVLALRLVPQPWRGVLDAGVVVGLLWGVTVTVWQTVARLRTRTVPA
ncbi:MAG: hypothetical protein AAGA23_20765 [Pseudomonadota bacterium]